MFDHVDIPPINKLNLCLDKGFLVPDDLLNNTYLAQMLGGSFTPEN